MMQQFYPQVFHDFRYELNKDMHFSAAHYVPHEDAGPCRQVHGHTYFVNVTIAGDELDDSGFLVNFKALKEIVHKRYDHSFMNDSPDFSDESAASFPTSEVTARVIWENVQSHLDSRPNKPKCLQVIVRETPTSYAVYRPKKGDFK